MGDIIWSPGPERTTATPLHRFTKRLGFDGYQPLWEWSTAARGEFWQAVWDFCGVRATQTPERPLGRESMPGTEWFPGARLNYAENLLRRAGTDPAIISADESGVFSIHSWDDLRVSVARVQAGLVSLGVGPGDRVAALLPNGPEAVVAFLATAATGAIWSSCSPDFGPTGIVDRFGQIRPTVLLTVDGYRYGGRDFDITPTVNDVLERIGVDAVVAIDRLGRSAAIEAATIGWDELTAGDATRPEFAQLPFDHPLYVLYSSGTTGMPKSIVHGAGGSLLKHLCEHQLHSDVRPGDRVFWFTTCGWMMWNWTVSALASEAAIVLYDGSPSHPDLGVLWRLAERARITHFGTSPKFLAALANAAMVPGETADLSSVRFLGSTGAPLSPEQFDWVYDHVSADLQLASISGGTDIVGLFAGGVPTLPVRRGELQARCLGMAVEAWGPDGRPVPSGPGELVCTAPFPSMPVRFWNDPDGIAYRSAYFERFPGVWHHGDFVEIRPEGGVVISGRSDTTLNPGGVRIGTAEIYRAIETMPEVADSIVAARPSGADVEVVLFVQPAPGVSFDTELADRIRRRIRTETSPRHVPAHVLEVDAIPYTFSGKKVEQAVQAMLRNETVTNRSAVANPESLDQYAGRLPPPG